MTEFTRLIYIRWSYHQRFRPIYFAGTLYI